MLSNLKVPKNKNFNPLYTITRESTEKLVAKSADVNRAIQYIDNNISKTIDVSQVVKSVGISRRSLEQKFANHIGRTILEQIHISKIAQAKILLKQSEVEIDDISTRCGFLSVRQMNALFKKYLNLTPRQFRNA